MTDNLFVIVMPIGSKNEHQNGIVVDSSMVYIELKGC